VSENWTTGLEHNAETLKHMARFYHSQGLFVIATLIGAATEALQEEMSKVRGRQRKEIHGDVRGNGQPGN
jgi:hypothetical protein